MCFRFIQEQLTKLKSVSPKPKKRKDDKETQSDTKDQGRTKTPRKSEPKEVSMFIPDILLLDVVVNSTALVNPSICHPMNVEPLLRFWIALLNKADEIHSWNYLRTEMGVSRKSLNDSPWKTSSQIDIVGQFLHYPWQLFCLGDKKLLLLCLFRSQR